MKPAQWTAPEDPLIDIAQHDDAAVRPMGESLKQSPYLVAALGGPQPEVGDHDAHRLPRNIEFRINGPAWFPARDAEVMHAAPEDAPTGEQDVAVGAGLLLKRHAGDGLQP